MGEAVPKDGSMEDILASIRRIISADTSKKSMAEKIEPAPIAQTGNGLRTSMPVDVQKPVTGSLSALAEKIRSGRSEAVSSHPTLMQPPMTPSVEIEKPQPVVSVAKPASLADIASQVTGRPAVREFGSVSGPKAEAAGVEGSGSKPDKIALETGDAKNNTIEPAEIVIPAASAPEASFSNAQTNAPGLSLKDLAYRVAQASGPVDVKRDDSSDEPSVWTSAMNVAAKMEQPDTVEPVVAGEPGRTRAGEAIEPSVKAFKEALMAPSTQAAVTNSMDRLRKSVEDIETAHVENVLRPMLKTWLDENLPSMVERMVQAEITKITAKK